MSRRGRGQGQKVLASSREFIWERGIIKAFLKGIELAIVV